ncbi:MAG: FHA domain-containing protein [Anaerolineales bacterium]|nr:MAG: FHA domain-containing protein [Anaerolineales bacterium]
MVGKETAVLILREGQGMGTRWMIDRDNMVIGREENCDIVLLSRQVSRNHARIRRSDGRHILEDLGSKNGTFVNGHKLTEPYTLQDGDEIQVALSFKLFFVDAGATVPLFFGEKWTGLLLDKDAKSVWIKGRELDPPLSLAQYRLLELLYDNEGKVCSRDEVVWAVWPDAVEEGISEQAIDALARRLRERLSELDSDHQYIVTVRGHGFRFDKLR